MKPFQSGIKILPGLRFQDTYGTCGYTGDYFVKLFMKLDCLLTWPVHHINQRMQMIDNKKCSYYVINLFASTYITILLWNIKLNTKKNKHWDICQKFKYQRKEINIHLLKNCMNGTDGVKTSIFRVIKIHSIFCVFLNCTTSIIPFPLTIYNMLLHPC